MGAGRPTKYSKEMIDKTRRYMDEYEPWYDVPVTVTSATGQTTEKMVRSAEPPILKRKIAKHLGIAWSTLCLWEKEHQEFSDLLNQRYELNEELVTENSLLGLYNGNFATKYMEAKHNWRAKQDVDITSGGKSIWDAIRAKRESNGED